jgi:hypothetical protein
MRTLYQMREKGSFTKIGKGGVFTEARNEDLLLYP